jgi:hypothetical protein
MKWVLKESKFKYNGRPVVRRTVVSDTPLGQFKVYESVGGRTFIVDPFIQKSGGLPGYDPDPENTFGTPKILATHLEEGIRRCEAKWEQIKKMVNNI